MAGSPPSAREHRSSAHTECRAQRDVSRDTRVPRYTRCAGTRHERVQRRAGTRSSQHTPHRVDQLVRIERLDQPAGGTGGLVKPFNPEQLINTMSYAEHTSEIQSLMRISTTVLCL